MAKTQTTLTKEQVAEKYNALYEAAGEFRNAIRAFEESYNPDTVGLDEWVESIDETLFDISADIAKTFGEY